MQCQWIEMIHARRADGELDMTQDAGATNQQQEQRGGSRAQTPQVTRSQLVQRLVSAENDLPRFIHDLVTTQVVTVAGTEAAAFLIEPDGTPSNKAELKQIAHIRPDQSTDEVRAAAIRAFRDVIGPCVEQGKDGAFEVSPADATGESAFCLVTLLRAEGKLMAASAVVTRCAGNERARQRLMSMQLIAGYFELYGMRRAQERAIRTVENHQGVLGMISTVATADGFEAAAANLCNELALRTHATRVSIGWLHGSHIRLKAISHTEKFDKKQELVRLLEQAMEESIDQETVVSYSPQGAGSAQVTRNAQALSRHNGGSNIVSLPLRRASEIIGVATLEFPLEHEMTEEAVSSLVVAVDIIASQLWDRYQNDRWLITKAGLSTKKFAEATVGPKYMITKLVVACLIIGLVLLFVIHPMYTVTAPFQFVAKDRRTISAPFEARITEVRVRPSDKVKAGDILIKLDSTELELQKLESEKKIIEAELRASDAEAQRKYGEAKIARAEAETARASADFYAKLIERHVIRAPIDGEVLRGDLMDKRDTIVKQGDALMEVGVRDQLEVELQVAERDIQDVMAGETGYLATKSQPTQKHKFTITRVVPVGDADQGRQDNVFKAYATLDTSDPSWLPGLEGEAKVDVERRTAASIWTKRVIDFIRLKLWV